MTHSPANCPHGGFRVRAGDAGHIDARVCDCVAFCKACEETPGRVMGTDARGYDILMPCKSCYAPRRRAELLNLSRIPNKYLDLGFTTYKPKTPTQLDALRKAVAFVDAAKRNERGEAFSLFGSVGAMKTGLLCSMLRELAMAGISGRYFSLPTSLQAMKDEFDGEDRFKGAMMSYLKSAKILVLDELHRVSTEFERETLAQIVMHRYDSTMQTFFLANASDEDGLTRALGNDYRAEAVVSRIYEMARPIWVKGPDARRSEKDEKPAERKPRLRVVEGE